MEDRKYHFAMTESMIVDRFKEEFPVLANRVVGYAKKTWSNAIRGVILTVCLGPNLEESFDVYYEVNPFGESGDQWSGSRAMLVPEGFDEGDTDGDA